MAHLFSSQVTSNRPCLPTFVIVLLFAARTSAWTTLSQSRYGAQIEGIRELQHGNYTGPTQSALGFLWTFPEKSTDSRGLGGGIAWAWDDELCPMIGHLFREDLFFMSLVRCKDMKAAMHRAFDSWAANHRFISFVDVTEECRELSAKTRGVANKRVRKEDGCPLVEIWVTARGIAAADAMEAATAKPIIVANDVDFRYTSGEYARTWNADNGKFQPRRVIETIGGVIEFGGVREGGDYFNPNDICWYLDSTFCYMFNRFKSVDPATIKTLVTAVAIAVTAIATLITCLQVLQILYVHVCSKGSCRARYSAAAEALARWSFFCTALRFVLIMTPILAWRQIFQPCFDCYDFEAAATHEVGHLLGLGHPDSDFEKILFKCPDCGPAGLNVMTIHGNATIDELAKGGQVYGAESGSGEAASASMAPPADCRFSFDRVVPDTREEPRESIMWSFTQHNPRVCLEQDDLDALNTLYPTCEHAMQQPVCFKSSHNIGWVRLGVYVLVPILIALVVAILIGSCTQKNQVRRIKSARQLIRQKSSELGHAARRVTLANAQAADAIERLEIQIATEDSRVSAAVDAKVDAEVTRILSEPSISRASAASRSNSIAEPPPHQPLRTPSAMDSWFRRSERRTERDSSSSMLGAMIDSIGRLGSGRFSSTGGGDRTPSRRRHQAAALERARASRANRQVSQPSSSRTSRPSYTAATPPATPPESPHRARPSAAMNHQMSVGGGCVIDPTGGASVAARPARASLSGNV